jgi:hypothetical protein
MPLRTVTGKRYILKILNFSWVIVRLITFSERDINELFIGYPVMLVVA